MSTPPEDDFPDSPTPRAKPRLLRRLVLQRRRSTVSNYADGSLLPKNEISNYIFDDKKSIVHPEIIGPYVLREELGEGAYSVVKVAMDKRDGHTYACKVVPRKLLLQKSLENQLEKEVRNLQKINHANVIEFNDVLKDTINFYIIMELCPCENLLELVKRKQRLDEETAKVIFKQLMLALQCCHQNGIAHRDIKPENIMVDSSMHVKLIDFGFSTSYYGVSEFTATSCGSPYYASPECFSGNPYDGMKSDIWSSGVVLYGMVMGTIPWTNVNPAVLRKQITTGNYRVPNRVSEECRDLISHMMDVNVDTRYNADQIMDHAWVRTARSAIPLRREIAKSTSSVSKHELDMFFAPSILIGSNSDASQHVPTKSFTGKHLLRTVTPNVTRNDHDRH